jgi:SAM-dependent methyltransferase
MPAGAGDRWPDDYERGRPGWPSAAVAVADLPPSATVLDLGAGTGKLTRVLVPAFRRVVAVEPADAMRRVLGEVCPTAEALAGSAQEIPLAEASVDAVFAAEAFHWFHDERALAEIIRVLRPGGALVLLWNFPAAEWEPSVADAEQLLEEHMPERDEASWYPLDLDGPHYTSGEWRLAFEGPRFEPLQQARLPNPQTLDRDGLVAFYASMGWIADLPDEERLPLLEKVRSRLRAAEYRREWETHAYWTRTTIGSPSASPSAVRR